MNAHTVRWLVFLALIRNFTCWQQNPFSLESPQQPKEAKEGSCVEIECKVSIRVDPHNAHWFWMKDASWVETRKDYIGTIIYSTAESERPVSQGFANRVKYSGSPPEHWKDARLQPQLCSILICNLNKTDSGNYSFRFKKISKNEIWFAGTKELRVVENPCLITFEKPPIFKENDSITLICSTLSSCPSYPQIDTSTQLPLTQLQRSNNESEKLKSTTYSIRASWQDDGRVFSCQTEDNIDKYLIKNVSIVVEYAPRDTLAKVSSATVKEGRSVTFTCSAKGRPDPVFTWFTNDQKLSSGAQWTISSIKDSQSGSYYCIAENKLGNQSSSTVTITVTYAPDVEIKIPKENEGNLEDVKQGDTLKLFCNVKRSNPQPHTFAWFKDESFQVSRGKEHVFFHVDPEDSGVYKCRATNTVGTGKSEGLHLRVKYRPRNTKISIQDVERNRVKVNKRLIMTCNTDAYPDPWFSWYRYKENDPSQKTPMMGQRSLTMTLEKVQRADEACYSCNATNSIDTGDTSAPMCIKVLFPPTSLMLSMRTEVIEGERITITCTAESYPSSHFTFTHHQSPKWTGSPTSNGENSVQHTFTATSTHAGFYACNAINSEGSATSTSKELVVKYAPKPVMVEAWPDLVVKENTSLNLTCKTRSNPPVSSVTWRKRINGENKHIENAQMTISVESVGPSDGGLYSCEVKNEIGTGKSQQVEVKVKYAPKQTKITKGEKQEQPDGTSSVILSCISHGYPPVKYSWYKKTEDDKGDVRILNSQNITVNSGELGEYYCIAKNEEGQRSSDSVMPFDDRIMKAVKLFLLICLILLILLLIFLLYRHRRNKSVPQSTPSTQPYSGFLTQWNASRRGNLMNEVGLAEPFRSRDDLFPHQPPPDSTPSSNISGVYSTVNLPQTKQAPSAQKPVRQEEEGSLNYASLHFGNKQKKGEEDAVYSKVCMTKSKPSEEKQEKLEDYENINRVHTAKPPYPSDYDTDTSDDEVEVNYSQVNFKPKERCLRAKRDSSTSEEETQYSEVKI